jgi:hypothetical protein
MATLIIEEVITKALAMAKAVKIIKVEVEAIEDEAKGEIITINGIIKIKITGQLPEVIVMMSGKVCHILRGIEYFVNE